MARNLEVAWWELQAVLDLAEPHATYVCDVNIIRRLRQEILDLQRQPVALEPGADDN